MPQNHPIRANGLDFRALSGIVYTMSLIGGGLSLCQLVTCRWWHDAGDGMADSSCASKFV